MGDAVANTENIRNWREQTYGYDKLAEHLKSDCKNGLTQAQADQSMLTHGANRLTDKAAVPWYCLFIAEMTGIFSLLLWFGGFLCFFGFAIQEDKEEDQSNLYLGIVLCLVVFVTGCFSFYQASSAESLMDDFKGFIPKMADVIRDGKEQTIGAENIAVGDLIKLKAGNNIPADVVLISATEMKINNASLTGESDDLLRIVNMENGKSLGDKKDNIFEADNVAFFGTQCTDGHGMGMVIKVGDSTIIGLIAGLTMVAETVETPLSIEIELFIKLIGAVALILGITFFLFGVAYGYDYITNLVFAIGIIVANVPEGLLCTVTVSLALTAERMAKKQVLVKNLESVETLGSTSCICSDKTGTLTQNRMTLCNMFISGNPIDCQINYQTYQKELDAAPTKEKKDKVPAPKYNINDSDFQLMVKTLALSTTSIFKFTPDTGLIKREMAKVGKYNIETLTKTEDWDKATADEKRQAAAVEKTLQEEEDNKDWIDKTVKGDASETGLLKFIVPLMLKQFNNHKDYPQEGLEPYRQSCPVLCNKAGNMDPYEIKFSSDIKFNLMIRDMNPAKQNPSKAEDNLTVFLKGAPDRVHVRCNTILEKGKTIELTENHRTAIENANTLFGNMGERVLGFSRLALDPKLYKKTEGYGTKDWRSWITTKEYSPKARKD